MLTNILEKQGFSPLEARVYFATLELGQAPASRIATKINENRVTVYSALEAMKKRDLILTVTKNKVVHYTAISPKSLLKNAQEKVDSLTEVMPDLLAIATLSHDKPSVQFFEGIEGLKLLYEDMLNYPETTMKSFLWHTETEPSLRRWLNAVFLPQRLKRKLFAQVLMPLADKERYGYDATSQPFQKQTEIRYVSDGQFSLESGIDLYGNEKVSIVIFTEHEMMGMIIKSKTLYATLSALFNLIWNHASHGK